MDAGAPRAARVRGKSVWLGEYEVQDAYPTRALTLQLDGALVGD